MHTDVICLLINYPPEVVGEGRGLGVCWLCHDDIFLIPLPPFSFLIMRFQVVQTLTGA